MTVDELLALKWLQGSDGGSREALIRLLQNPPLSNPDICHCMARLLTPVAVGETRLTLVMSSRRGPGRPPKDQTVKGVVRTMQEAGGQLEAEADTFQRSKKMVRKWLYREIKRRRRALHKEI